MKILSISAVAFIALPLVVQVDAKIHGTWQHNSPGDELTLILQEDGSGEFGDEPIKYKAERNTFTITVIEHAETLVYQYSIQGNSLTISGGDLDAPITFVRKADQKKE